MRKVIYNLFLIPRCRMNFYRVKAAWVPGATLDKALDAFDRAAIDAKFIDRFMCIVRT